MPWHIDEDHPDCDGFAVVLDSNDSVVEGGCHESLGDAEAHMAALYASEEESMTQLTIFTFPARVSTRTLTAAEQDALLETLDLEDEVDPFFWAAEISSDRIDSYYTHMTHKTLQNYASDASAGVSFLDSHNSYQLGFGQSVKGRFEKTNGVARVVADFYTVPGISFGGGHSYQSTDDFIRAVKARLTRDVSIGFIGGDHICDICGGNYFIYAECPHFPGIEYPVGEQGESTIICTIAIDDAHLSEVSAVYDGATPEAMILKAEAMSRAGVLLPNIAEVLRAEYRIKLPGAEQSVFAATKPKERGKLTMTKELQPIRDLLAGHIEGEDVVAGIRSLIERVSLLEEERDLLISRIADLEPLANAGRAYRSDLIGEALTEGVRAQGDAFPEDTYRGILEDATIERIKEVRASFAKQADEFFASGRQTEEEGDLPPDEEEEEEQGSEVDLTVPDEAYSAI